MNRHHYFFIWRDKVISAEVENMAALQSFTLGMSGGMLPQAILGVLRHILRHTGKHTELLERKQCGLVRLFITIAH